MKTIINIFTPFLILLFVTSGCDNTEYSESQFWVRGNCEMCKEDIEEALNDLDGVKTAEWNVETEIATVKYDPAKLTETQLHEATAGVGHETKDVEADEEAYNNLPKCCKRVEDM